jgi:hypothetical protein
VPPIVVAGLPWSDAEYAADKLRTWGFDITPSRLVPAELDAFCDGGGLLVWIQADTAARLRICRRGRRKPRFTEAELRVARDGMFEDWRRMVLDDQPHPGYALKLAHIIICHDGDRRLLLASLRQMRRWLEDKPVFTPRQTHTRPVRPYEAVIGERYWEVRQFGCRPPPPQGFTLAGRQPGQ